MVLCSNAASSNIAAKLNCSGMVRSRVSCPASVIGGSGDVTNKIQQQLLSYATRACDDGWPFPAAQSPPPQLIPDTNALIYSLHFQEWSFDEFSEFGILLVPTVLPELGS